MNELVYGRELVIKKEGDLFWQVKVAHSEVWLNLGCGSRLLPGFLNIDLWPPAEIPPDIYFERADIKTLPVIEDGSVDGIFAAHCLEHLSIRGGLIAIGNWSRKLKPGGRLYCSVPDIVLIAENLISHRENKEAFQWDLFTLYGYQIDPNKKPWNGVNLNPQDEEDPGQFHRSGYSPWRIRSVLEEAGLIPEEIFNYDGWGTPSIWTVSRKPGT